MTITVTRCLQELLMFGAHDVLVRRGMIQILRSSGITVQQGVCAGQDGW